MDLFKTPRLQISELCNGGHITKRNFRKRLMFLLLPSRAALSAAKQERLTVFFISVTNEFEVLTNYILSLYTVSVRKSYDVSELGLSCGCREGTCNGYSRRANPQPTIETQKFPQTDRFNTDLLSGHSGKGIMAQNQLMELATEPLSDLMEEHPEHRTEAK